MKSKRMRTLCLLFTLCMLLCVGAMATDTTDLTIRVNGQTVVFPDAQPYVDENSRTLIPVRFVTEELGATVTWEGKTQTANIEKNGITVAITIGNANLQVTQNGKTETVKMDTAAVLKNGRTYVPIRFVAEALGAWVDYSNTYRVVGIYQDELTAEQIATLQAMPLTGNSLRSNTHTLNASDFADCREVLYSQKRTAEIYFHSLGETQGFEATEDFWAKVIEDAEAAIEYHSDNLDVEFVTDASCLYYPFEKNTLIYANLRGYAVVTAKSYIMDLTPNETYLIATLLHIPKFVEGETYTFPIDAHIGITNQVQMFEVERLDSVDNTAKSA